MLSRVANAVYWMSRYLERADNVARFVHVNIHLMLDLGLEHDNGRWAPLVAASGDDDDFRRRYDDHNEKNVLHFLTFDEENPNSILSCIHRARENARTVREILSSDLWMAINDVHHLTQKQARRRKIGDLQDFYLSIRRAGYVFTGLLEDTMTHGEAWHFADLGRMLERADKTARILDVKYFLLLPSLEYFDSPYDAVEWSAVLKSVSAFEMYLKQHHTINYKNVADFLIFHPSFPRSILRCTHQAARSLHSIVAATGRDTDIEQSMATLRAFLADATIDSVLNHGMHEFIDTFQTHSNALDREIGQTFFAD